MRSAYEFFQCECGEQCVMLPHERTGKLAPITLNLYDDGNIEKTGSVPGSIYRVVSKGDRESNPKMRHYNHWTNCTGKSFQRKKAPV